MANISRRRNSGSEAIDRKLFARIVFLNDFSNGLNGLLIAIQLNAFYRLDTKSIEYEDIFKT